MRSSADAPHNGRAHIPSEMYRFGEYTCRFCDGQPAIRGTDQFIEANQTEEAGSELQQFTLSQPGRTIQEDYKLILKASFAHGSNLFNEAAA